MTASITRRVALVALAAAAFARPAAAQGYRATIDLRAQSVAFRGWQLDSIPASEAVPSSSGALQTPSGIAVDCSADPFVGQCYYYAPGARQQAAPMVLTTDMTAWGFGIKGLSARANLRYTYNLGDAVWPNTQPSLQFYEGYLDYQQNYFGLRGGRMIVTNRLGWTGFDGGLATVRVPKLGLDVSGFGGWGLARSVAIGVNDSLTAPLGDYIPPDRSLTFGAYANVRGATTDFRFDWLRQIDTYSDYLISDQLAASGTIRPAPRFAVTGGVIYDLAQSRWGSADASLRYTMPRLQLTGGYRRYMPRFDLYTVWEAFSPVAWNGVQASAIVTPLRWLQLRARGEYVDFEDTGTSDALFYTLSDGFRTSFGGTVTPVRNVSLDVGYNLEEVTGAWISGLDASVTWLPSNTTRLRVYGAYAQRPLEYRYDASTAKWIGIDGDARVAERLSLGFSVVQMYEDRERPDNASFDWNQTRLMGRVSYYFASRTEPDRRGLPDAVKRMPSSVEYGR